MAQKGFLVDAVAQFVQSNEWRDAVTHFLESHFKRFLAEPEDVKPQSKVAGYTLEQFDSFMAFKDRVERLLEKVVADLGCSGDDLVEAIRDNLSYESALSTEKRFCIQTLLSFDDFDAFYSRISEFKVDLLVAQRIAEANAQMKKQMLNLAAGAADQDEQTEDVSTPEKAAEEELAGLFTQIETISERLKDVKSRCFKFESVTQQQMDTIYLFLKEKVHYKQDLVSQEKEISAFIFTQIQEKDEALIPLMLEWLLLESEQLRAQNQIQEQLAGPRDEGYWTQVWDEASQAFYYVNSVSKESVWEPPSAGYYDTNQEFQVPGLESEAVALTSTIDTWSPQKIENIQEAAYPEKIGSAESKVWGELSARGVPTESEAFSSGARSEEPVPTLDQASSQLDATFELKIGPDATEMHDQERKRLELVFALEKARQKEELRKRKEKRRREKLAKRQKQKEEAFRDDVPKDDGEASAQPLPAPVTSRVAEKVEVKPDEKSPLSINVPGHGRIDLSHLLSDAHASRHRQLKGIMPAHERVMLNPATLRYLTEQMAIKQPEVLGQQVSLRTEIVLEEFADEK
ncbi:unnamed protein product [Phytophthora fragariaefolia]|uniref:Cilia- and flagella-associated protein 36 n=1 Tax=Phytophthora fragariaefolia TaxID=1490495 RepID=A0A9W6Y5U9_9STRA|nr:unnamed protein product [Phytophthora fragariaefolia]